MGLGGWMVVAGASSTDLNYLDRIVAKSVESQHMVEMTLSYGHYKLAHRNHGRPPLSTPSYTPHIWGQLGPDWPRTPILALWEVGVGFDPNPP